MSEELITEEGAMRLYEWVTKSAKTTDALKQKTDSEIADLLFEHIQGHVDVRTAQYDLLEIAIARLKGCVGCKNYDIDTDESVKICEQCEGGPK